MNDQRLHDMPRRFISLRTKFVLLLALIIIVACSSLSWYFIQNKASALTDRLISLGTVLTKNLAHNSRYGLFTEDQILLGQYLVGVMDVEEVVYVVISGPQGNPLAATSKGRLTESKQLTRSFNVPLYPDSAYAKGVFASGSRDPIITSFTAAVGATDVVHVTRGKAGSFPVPIAAAGDETVYDFAVPVTRRSQSRPLLPEMEAVAEAPEKVYGVVQIGLTSAKMQQALHAVIWNVAWITALIILGGIAATVMLADRIIKPMRNLAAIAKRVAEGDLNASVVPTTHDEVGRLTSAFNQMTRSLVERDLAISSHIRTIMKQVGQLTALNQAGAAITSTLDLDKVLTTVLRLVVENLGFTRMLLMLYDDERRIAYGARMVGVPEEMERAARDVKIPIQDDGSHHAELLIRGRPILVPDITAVEDRVYPLFRDLARQVGVTSFVCAPLKTKQRVLGYVAADKAGRPCAQEDLDLLVTIASEVAVAIDNARAYQQLEKLTITLEQRVRERTQELEVANARLHELDRLKSVFVSNVSHELRTPMTSIKGYVENMLEGLGGGITEKQSHYLSRIKYNVERLTRMINDLLDLSRIEAGRVELCVGPVSVHEIVAEVVESFVPMARGKSVSLSAHFSGVLPMIQGDRDKIHQILGNLIQNAIKFTPAGGTIRVEPQARDDGLMQICVTDTGCGIAPRELDRVFERFYRSESAPGETRGAGLGLAIAKSLVELHGGRIWVSSTPGQGSRFFFTVPVEPRIR